MANAKILHLNSQNFFDTVKASKTPVLVDFWAEWCGPCKAIAPILDELANEYDGKLTIAKVNVDDSQEVAVKYSIRNIPTLLIFRDGGVVGTIVGARPKGQFKTAIDNAIG